jgi:hypothetical protein
MLDQFLEGGGSATDAPTMQYRCTLFELRQNLDHELIFIGHMSKPDQDKYMARQERLGYRDISQRLKKNGASSATTENGHRPRPRRTAVALPATLEPTTSPSANKLKGP